MKKYSLPVLYILVTVLLLANCIREIDFQEADADRSVLVVSGTFTDGYGPHVVRLTRPGNYDKQVFEPVLDAEIRLSDDLGNIYAYQSVVPPDKPAYYELRNVKGETGRTYTLDIRLSDGEQYRSHPQRMPEPVALDTAEVRGEWYYTNTADGDVVRAPFAFVYARTTAPTVTKDRYLHWESEATYIFNEISPKPYAISAVSHQCFINNRINDQVVAIADLSKYTPGSVIYENAGKRRIDQAFEQRIAFTVYQRVINREAYEYWDKINKLLTANGTIFDAPPAVVVGNVENTGYPDRPALGFFEVGAADTVRIYSGNGQLGSEFLLQNVPFCQLDYTRWPPVNQPECDDCLTWIKGAFYEMPWWWE